MPALFIYLIKVNVALLIFCLGYYLVLRHLTFYTLNRIYLVMAIIFSTLYPKVNLSGYLNRHEEIARPMQVVIVNWQAPVRALVVHDEWYWLQMIFWIGVCLFGIRLLTQLLSLYRLHKTSEPVQLQHYMIRVIQGNINPFSFWRNIYINPANHPPHELNAILEHEQIHVNEWHTLDILLGEISAIFYWFNPGIWLMKRAIRENIEFITDRKILQKGMDSKAYQYSLINVNFGAQSNAIVNHFNISTIKKRIMMMNAKRSSSVNITRYVFLIPAVMLLLLVFSVSKAELSRTMSKSSAGMMKALKSVVTKIDFAATQSTVPVRKKVAVLKAAGLLNIRLDTVKPAGKLIVADTSKKFTIRLRHGGNGEPEPDIYIDGVKVTYTYLDNINPNDIAYLEARKDTVHSTVNIVTKSHAKLDTANFKGAKGGIKRVYIQGGNGPGVVVDTMYASRSLPDPNTHFGIVITKGINGKGQTTTFKDSVVYVVGDDINSGKGHMVAKSMLPRMGQSASIDHFSDKLIILNGKESTQKELKKVSAGDIESVSVLKGEAATTKYGDKGKNGVVIITTKN